MYYGSVESWNLRDQHMFDTLRLLLDFGGRRRKAVVWEHNSHIGDAAATGRASQLSRLPENELFSTFGVPRLRGSK